MSFERRLDELRASEPACRIVAFIDLGVAMVLSASAQRKQRQERLDAMAKMALHLFADSEDRLAKIMSFGEDLHTPDTATLLSADETLVFVKSSSQPNEALCCSCAPDVDVDAIIAGARATLLQAGTAE